MAGQVWICNISKQAAKDKVVHEDLAHCRTTFSPYNYWVIAVKRSPGISSQID